MYKYIRHSRHVYVGNEPPILKIKTSSNAKNMKIKLGLLIIFGFLLSNIKAFSQDPDFYIFLCFGQSNKEDNARIQPQDTIVDDRFSTSSRWRSCECRPGWCLFKYEFNHCQTASNCSEFICNFFKWLHRFTGQSVF